MIVATQLSSVAVVVALVASDVVLLAGTAMGRSTKGPPRKPGVPAATLEGPITVGEITTPFDPRNTDLAKLGYVESEWFASGTATRYAQVGERTADGRWEVTPDGQAPYKTRIIVRMPADPKDFRGVVALEWINVSAFELAPDWAYLSNDAIARTGVAWIGISAQALGIEGGEPILDTGEPNASIVEGIKVTNPTRYASLVHPGDAYSFDIYSQVGAALRSKRGRSVVNGARIKRVLAIGESQSAGFLTAYVNGVDRIAKVFDGYFVHSRFAGAANYDGTPSIRNATVGYRIRTDLKVPVFVFETETDTLNGYARAWQPDTKGIRVWEVAGTAHSDTYLVGALARFLCTEPINDGPQHWVAKAAFTHLVEWVTNGTAPPHAQPIESDDTTIHRDGHGIALGGIRTPDVDVPVATLSGENSGGGRDFCRLLGSTVAFDDATLRSLYPTTEAYVTAFNKALNKAIRAGYVRKSDRDEYAARAEEVTIPD